MAGLTSPWHWIALVAIVLFLFGAKRLPDMGRLLGKGMREFKDTTSSLSVFPEEKRTPPRPTPSPPAQLPPAPPVPERTTSRDRDSI